MKIINKTQGTILATEVEIADSILSRLVGLLNRASLSENAGLIITDCRSIHMFFMRFAIDVIFLDRRYKVVGLVKGIKPFRLSPYFWRAYYAVELPSGTINKSKVNVGDQLSVE